MTRTIYHSLPAMLTLGLMLGGAIELIARPTPKYDQAYQQFVRDVAAQLPKQFGDWISKDQESSAGAVKLLRPNVMIQRRFVNSATGETASLLIVHCGDIRDLDGHWPPICYPNQGYATEQAVDREWVVRGRKLPGREYTFSETKEMLTSYCHVYGLLLLPGGGIVRDMSDIRGARADFLRQPYGASQMQVVMDESISAERRNQIYTEIMEANIAMIDALTAKGSK